MELTKTEFDLLDLFMRNASHRPRARDTIYDRIWGYRLRDRVPIARRLRRLPPPQDRARRRTAPAAHRARRRLRPEGAVSLRWRIALGPGAGRCARRRLRRGRHLRHHGAPAARRASTRRCWRAPGRWTRCGRRLGGRPRPTAERGPALPVARRPAARRGGPAGVRRRARLRLRPRRRRRCRSTRGTWRWLATHEAARCCGRSARAACTTASSHPVGVAARRCRSVVTCPSSRPRSNGSGSGWRPADAGRSGRGRGARLGAGRTDRAAGATGCAPRPRTSRRPMI